jgi:hypothetical protein
MQYLNEICTDKKIKIIDISDKVSNIKHICKWGDIITARNNKNKAYLIRGKEDVKKFLNNPGCPCNHPIYKKVLSLASKELAKYYPSKEEVDISEIDERFSLCSWCFTQDTSKFPLVLFTKDSPEAPASGSIGSLSPRLHPNLFLSHPDKAKYESAINHDPPNIHQN